MVSEDVLGHLEWLLWLQKTREGEAMPEVLVNDLLSPVEDIFLTEALSCQGWKHKNWVFTLNCFKEKFPWVSFSFHWQFKRDKQLFRSINECFLLLVDISVMSMKFFEKIVWRLVVEHGGNFIFFFIWKFMLPQNKVLCKSFNWVDVHSHHFTRTLESYLNVSSYFCSPNI